MRINRCFWTLLHGLTAFDQRPFYVQQRSHTADVQQVLPVLNAHVLAIQGARGLASKPITSQCFAGLWTTLYHRLQPALIKAVVDR